jgi:non-specific protein-tyrosine kinase
MLKNNKIFSLFEENPVTDQIKALRAQVLQRLEESGGNSLLVTSANSGEGKTFTAINLGVSIAQELDRTVLLVDADLRNPVFKHYDFASDFFGVEVGKGLADYLTDSIEIPDLLLNPGIKKLTILPGGRILPSSAELLGSARMKALVTELKNRYREDRVIIFDSPALLVCTDPLVLSNYVEGILLVVEEERTTDKDIKRVTELLKDKPVLGTVLNKSKG